jgi:lysozyme family protein
MHPRTEELLNFLLTTQIRLREAVDSVSPAARNEPAPEGRWSVAEVLDHLALVETGITRIITKKVGDARASGLEPERDTSSILWSLDVHKILDRAERQVAPERTRPTARAGVDDAWRRLEEANAAARNAVASTGGLAIGGISHVHPSFGPLNLYQWIIFLGAHELRHALQIREVESRPPA